MGPAGASPRHRAVGRRASPVAARARRHRTGAGRDARRPTARHAALTRQALLPRVGSRGSAGRPNAVRIQRFPAGHRGSIDHDFASVRPRQAARASRRATQRWGAHQRRWTSTTSTVPAPPARVTTSQRCPEETASFRWADAAPRPSELWTANFPVNSANHDISGSCRHLMTFRGRVEFPLPPFVRPIRTPHSRAAESRRRRGNRRSSSSSPDLSHAVRPRTPTPDRKRHRLLEPECRRFEHGGVPIRHTTVMRWCRVGSRRPAGPGRTVAGGPAAKARVVPVPPCTAPGGGAAPEEAGSEAG